MLTVMQKRYRRLSGDERSSEAKRLAELYGRGRSIRELAAEGDHSIGRVRALLIEAGVTFRPRGGRPQATQVSIKPDS